MARQKAWRIHAYGGSEALELDTIDVPEPGPGEVLVKVRAVGLNRSDLLWISAGFFQPVLPAQVGAEICGEVEKCGMGVTAFAPGDRVSNVPIMLRGAGHAYSNFAEYALFCADELILTPKSLTDVEGAAFLCTNLTQMCALTETVAMRAGQTILVTAGSSANGLSAIHLAKHFGLAVITTTRTAEKHEMLHAAGADLIVATSEQSLSGAVSDFTQGRGVDLVYDCVGGNLTNEIVRSIRPGGNWVMYGFLDPQPFKSDWPLWFAHQLTLHIYSLPQFTGLKEMGMPGRPLELARALNSVVSLCSKRSVPIPIAREFAGIECVKSAFQLMEANGGGGKIVVRFS